MDKSFTGLLKRHRTFLIPYLILFLICLLIHFTFSKIDLFLWTNVRHNEFFDQFFKILTLAGDEFTIVVIVFGMLLVKYRYFILLFLAYAYSSVIVQILKRIFNSPRPSKFFEGLNPIRTIEGYPLYEWNSFPSGHAASAFTLAVVLSYILPHKGRHWIILPFAILVSFSRVYLSQHFFQDVVAGSMVGVILTFQIIWWLENRSWFLSPKLDASIFRKAPRKSEDPTE